MPDNSSGSVVAAAVLGGWLVFVWWYPSTWNPPASVKSGERGVLLKVAADHPWRHVIRRDSAIAMAAAVSPASSGTPADTPSVLTVAPEGQGIPAQHIKVEHARVIEVVCSQAASCHAVLALKAADLAALSKSTGVVWLWLRPPAGQS
jgi:hypothetical protein